MEEQLEQIKVNITRIISPAEFWVQIENHHVFGNRQAAQNRFKANDQSCRTKDRRVPRREPLIWKCHLAFVAPTTPNAWSLTATDKFSEYTKRLDQLAITIPSLPSQRCRSNAVVLWGVLCNRKTNALEATEKATWLNINSQLIFQGVARSTVDIEILEHNSRMVVDFKQSPDKDDSTENPNQTPNSARKRRQWPAAEPCSAVEFTGTPVCIDHELSIYVQDAHHQSRVREMSCELSKSNSVNDAKYKKWWRGDLCIVKLNDDSFYRAQIKAFFGKEQKCKVLLVDFGRVMKVRLENISKDMSFANVPIQVRKLHLLNVTLVPNERIIQRAKNFANDTILNHNCSIYIHENVTLPNSESIPCTICPSNAQLDLASLLVSQGLAKIASYFNRKDEFDEDKRIRKDWEEVVLKDSTELTTVEQFQLFYKTNKVVLPVDPHESHADERKYDGFALPSKQSPPIDNVSSIRHKWHETSDPMIERITKHFTLLQWHEREFYCQPFYVIDPVTILVVVEHTKIPNIDATEQEKNPLLPENAACIAFVDKIWCRGIVWQKISTNRYEILLVDTLKIVEVKRCFVQSCPQYLLHSKLQYMKVRLSRLIPNAHLRAQDVCSQLSAYLFDDKSSLFAKVIERQEDGIPEIRLYTTDSRKCIFNALTKSNIYKKNCKII